MTSSSAASLLYTIFNLAGARLTLSWLSSSGRKYMWHHQKVTSMRRWLLAAVLVCAFIILAAYYYANVSYHLDYLRESEVSANYNASVGRNVLISGEVVATGAPVAYTHLTL